MWPVWALAAFELGLEASSSDWTAYLLITLLIIGDSIIPILPGETTLVAGAAAAAEGSLNIWLVALAGAAGAIIGDSLAYWIGRRGHGTMREWVTQRAGEENVGRVEEMFVRRGTVVIVFGRWIPGVRLLVNLTAGGLVPYRKFLPLSMIGGTLWSLHSSIMAYLIGHALGGFWASLIISLAVSGLVIGVIGYIEKRRHDAGKAKPGQPLPVPGQ